MKKCITHRTFQNFLSKINEPHNVESKEKAQSVHAEVQYVSSFIIYTAGH
jgi:hypothetical protein